MTRSLNLVGHPFIPIGMGEHIRSTYRCLNSVAQPISLTDIFGYTDAVAEDHNEFSASCTQNAGDINVYHINGNEVEATLSHLLPQRGWSGYNIIYPLWELSRYPTEWARLLDRFDEIWAPSKFVYDALSASCSKPVFHMPMACEVKLTKFYGRRYFNIPETAYVFLFFYDLRSFTCRKNPHAVLEAFTEAIRKRPYSNAHLIIKVNGVDMKPDEYALLKEIASKLGSRITLIHKVMTSTEVKNLMRSSDCFVSLHRSEGYGFGIAEAMVLGKPVISTAYSGNMDFMDATTAFTIDYQLISVKQDEYPHYEDQVWADPDVEQATAVMVKLLDNPDQGFAIGQLAQKHMLREFSYKNIGVNYLNRFQNIDSKNK